MLNLDLNLDLVDGAPNVTVTVSTPSSFHYHHAHPHPFLPDHHTVTTLSPVAEKEEKAWSCQFRRRCASPDSYSSIIPVLHQSRRDQ